MVGLAVLLHCTLGAAIGLERSVREFRAESDVTFPEGATIYVARRAQQGKPIYQDFRQTPHVPALYGPLTYYSIGGLGRLFHADPLGLYTIGRSISLVASIMTVVALCWGLCGDGGVSRLAILAATLACISMLSDAGFTVAARPDAPALCCATFGFVLWLRRHDRAAGLAYVAAAFFKQSYLAGPLTLSFWLLVTRDWVRLSRFTGTYVGLSSIGWGGAWLAGGNAIWLNLLSANVFPLQWSEGFAALGRLSASSLVAAWAAGCWLLFLGSPSTLATGPIESVARRRRAIPGDVVSVFAIVTLLWGLLTAMKVGSSTNYFLETLVCAAWLLGRVFSHLLETSTRATNSESSKPGITSGNALVDDLSAFRTANRGGSTHRVGRAVVSVAVLATIVFQSPRIVQRAAQAAVQLVRGQEPAESKTVADATVRRLVLASWRRIGGPVLCSDARLIVLSDQEPVAIDWFLWAGLVQQGAVPIDHVLSRIRRREFALVVLDFATDRPPPKFSGVPWWPPQVTEHVQQYYLPGPALGDLRTYVPRPDPQH